MTSVINYHVIDPKNIGDLISSPSQYFLFPGFKIERSDIRDPNLIDFKDKQIIVGGGGLLTSKFLESIVTLSQNRKPTNKLIAWGIGQQNYNEFDNLQKAYSFNYDAFLNSFDLIGIRDFGFQYDWVPCASCMHSSFDKARKIKHEFVVFSHKKFQIKIDGFPRMTNESNNINKILDFLGSGETILTSSYHGAYWGTLLGRKVLAFPFTSKFLTLKHQPAIYHINKWRQDKKQIRILNKLVYEFHYKNKFSCPIDDWQTQLKNCKIYPESLLENRSRNQWYYNKVMELMSN